MLEETFYVSGQREQLIRDSEHLKEKIDKLTEMLSLSENHAKELCLEQEKLLV